jgi:hypothetical protein
VNRALTLYLALNRLPNLDLHPTLHLRESYGMQRHAAHRNSRRLNNYQLSVMSTQAAIGLEVFCATELGLRDLGVDRNTRHAATLSELVAWHYAHVECVSRV